MSTTSSYYSDLEYPTVNQDGSTWGGITNTYLDEVLKKVKALSDRITTAQGQLGEINRGTNAVDNLNSTLSSLIGTNALLPGTGTTLLPDPYSGTYTKTTVWPAFTSELSSYSPPTTQSEVESFDYQGFSSALTTELNRIDATVTQAEADILAAQKDTCRTKKYIDAYNNRTTTLQWTNAYYQFTNSSGGQQILSNWDCNYVVKSASSTSITLKQGSFGGAFGNTFINAHNQWIGRSNVSSGIPSSGPLVSGVNTNSSAGGSTSGHSVNDYKISAGRDYVSSIQWHSISGDISLNETAITLSGTFSTSAGTLPQVGTNFSLAISFQRVAEFTSGLSADLSECENPSPPYFN